MVSHIPYRAWCSHCVFGRGKSFAHHRVNRQEDPEEVPVVSIDYGFFGAPGELPADAVGGAQTPVLVVRDRKSKALFSHLVPSKGVEHFYPEHALVRDIKFLGYPSVVIKSDQEPAIKALAEAVKNSFAAKGGVRVQLENSPKGDDHGKSNGEAEAAVEITQGLCRTYKDACEKGLGVLIDPKSPLLGWLVEHAGSMYTLYAHDEASKDGHCNLLLFIIQSSKRIWFVALQRAQWACWPGGARAETALNQGSAVLQASIAPPLERVWSKLEKSVAGVHPDWEDVDTVLEGPESPCFLGRRLGPLTGVAGRSRRPRPSTQGPRLPAARLWLQAYPRLQPRCRLQVESCGTQPAPSALSSLQGACTAELWHWRPSQPQS